MPIPGAKYPFFRYQLMDYKKFHEIVFFVFGIIVKKPSLGGQKGEKHDLKK